MNIEMRPVQIDELDLLIEFDNTHLLAVMQDLGLRKDKCAPSLTQAELLEAIERQDILSWVFADQERAGYFWREKQADCLFGKGAALRKEFYGLGLIERIISWTETMAREMGFSICRLAVATVNGRCINAYLRHGYHIGSYVSAYSGPEHPHTFRCIMEKSLVPSSATKVVVARCEVPCVDEARLRELLDQGYVGVGYLRAGNGNVEENKIIFEL